eukprot:7821208-Alexandrium_andersonii.AAC.1
MASHSAACEALNQLLSQPWLSSQAAAGLSVGSRPPWAQVRPRSAATVASASRPVFLHLRYQALRWGASA